MLNFALAISALGIGLIIIGGMAVFQSLNAKPGQKKKTPLLIGIIAGAIVNCCVLRNSLSGGFLHDTVLEGTSFDDECDLFVAA